MTKKSASKKSSKKTAGKAMAAQRITKRIVDARRHTTGYVIEGKEVSVSQARSMAAAGRLRGVQVVGEHIQAVPGRRRRLSTLPTMIKK